MQLERLTFFSDAALGRGLIMLIPQYVGFIVSFVVLGRFWVTHHRLMGMLRASDTRLVWTNLLFLLAVAFMPFPTAIISEFVQLRVGIGFYAGWLIVLGVANRAIVHAAIGDRRLVDEAVGEDDRLTMLRASWTSIILGVLAFAAGMVTPLLAPVALALGGPVIGRLVRRRALPTPP